MIAFAKTKAALRAEGSVVRDTITSARREAASAAIADRVIAVAETARPQVIAVYMPIWSEVDTGRIIDWAFDNNIGVVLPAVVDSANFEFRRYRASDVLVAARFGTRAPAPDAGTANPDLVVMPMIAFDRAGTRLGYGGGFYDRGVARLRAEGIDPLLVGVAFAAQEVPVIPAEAHDVRMGLIVTENETLNFRVKKKG